MNSARSNQTLFESMFYVAHKVYFENNDPLTLHVVQVVRGRVVSLFPFDGERQSMVWVDALLLSDNMSPDADVVLVPKSGNTFCSDTLPKHAFLVERVGKSLSLRPVK